MNFCRLICVFMFCFTLSAVATSYAQDRLPNAVMTASTLTSDQRATLERVVRDAMNDLRDGSDEQVAQARQHLMSEYRRAGALNASNAFFRAYATEIATSLPQAMRSERLITRVNAMILAQICHVRPIVPVLVTGLGDDAAVRFTTAQSIDNLVRLEQEADSRVFETEDYQAILGALTAALADESQDQTVRALYLAMARLPIPEARQNVLNTLEARLEQFRQSNGQESIASEEAAMRAMYMDLTMSRRPVMAKEISQSAARYLVFCARQMEQQNLPQNLQDQHLRMIEVCEAVLVYSSDPIANVPQLQQRTSTIEQLQQAIRNQQWLEAALFAEQLRTALSNG